MPYRTARPRARTPWARQRPRTLWVPVDRQGAAGAQEIVRPGGVMALRREALDIILPILGTFSVVTACALTPVLALHQAEAVLALVWGSTSLVVGAWFLARLPASHRAGAAVTAALSVGIVAALVPGFGVAATASFSTAVIVATACLGTRWGVTLALGFVAQVIAVWLGFRVPTLETVMAHGLSPRLVEMVSFAGAVPHLGLAVLALNLVLQRHARALHRERVRATQLEREVRARAVVEEALRESEARAHAVLAAVPEAIAVLDAPLGRLTEVNPAWERMYGWTRAEVLGRTPVELSMMPSDRVAALGERVAQQAVLPSVEETTRRRDGTRVVVQSSVTRVSMAGAVRVVVVARDVTAMRDMEEKLRNRQRAEVLGNLVAGVAHNFNNALGAVLPNLESVREVAPAALTESLDDALEAARRAADLARQLMVVARGEPDRARATVDIGALLGDVVDVCRDTFGGAVEVTYVQSPGGVTAPVRASHGALRQVFLNLVMNARDAMAGTVSPRVAVQLTVEDRQGPGGMAVRYAVVTVTDTGHGMPPELVARLGEPFLTTRPPGEGTGLGLASAYAIVRDLEGDIGCQSVPGTGTTFTVSLPVDPSRSAMVPTAGRVAPAVNPEAHVLLVDDDPLVRRTLTRMLVRWGYAVTTAADGVEALAIVREQRAFLCILLDLSMPRMDGLQVREALRTVAPWLPVVIVTGNATVPDLPDVAGVVAKPVNLPYLQALLRHLGAGVPGPAPVRTPVPPSP